MPILATSTLSGAAQEQPVTPKGSPSLDHGLLRYAQLSPRRAGSTLRSNRGVGCHNYTKPHSSLPFCVGSLAIVPRPCGRRTTNSNRNDPVNERALRNNILSK